ncbi:MAG: hypothetical protein Q9195_000629 [Heterodermia aff. obscurata]
MDTKAPLTPPSDRMDLDSHGNSLQNGHALKDSSLDKSVALDSSFHIPPADNLKSYLHNNAVTAEGTPDASQPDTSQETADLNLPTSSEADLTSTAFISSAPEQVNDFATSTAGQVSEADKVALNPTLGVVQAPTSDSREEPQPATSSQNTEIKEQKQDNDLIDDPGLADGLPSKVPESSLIELNWPDSSPGAATGPQADTSSLPDGDQMESSLNAEVPVSINTADIPHHPPVPLPEGAEIEAPIDPAPSPADGRPALSTPVNPSTPSPQIPEAPADQVMQEHVAQPVSTEEVIANGSSDQIDQPMQDAPPSPAKVARPREEDDLDSQPAVKRPRTDGEEDSAPDFKKPERPEISTEVNGIHASPSNVNYAQLATVPQHKHMLRILGNIKRSKDATAFLHPVDVVALKIPNYPNIVTKPMDLSTLEEKEKARDYPSIDAFVADFNQIIQNTEMFNGAQHGVTQSAYKMKASFLKGMEKLPGPEVAEPVRADKKKKAIFSNAEKPVPTRRESRSSLPAMARSPITPATPTFALGPQGIPLIRRDSAVNAERPKREIHPPAPRDLPYANQKPKKKKYQMELKFCQHVLNEIKKPRYRALADPFLSKVDPVALNIPTYFNVIRQPMDFGTIQQKLNQGEYENAREFDQDAQLVFANCYKFNPAGHPIHEVGKQLQHVYDDVWQDKQAWIEKQAPPSGPTSADTTPEASEDEDEEEEEEPDASNEILKLQQQIAAMSKQVELITQKKKSPPVASKKAKGAPKVEKKSHKKAAQAPVPKNKSSKPVAKGVEKKPPYVTYEQKQDISNRINSLPEVKMGQALSIIRDNMPKLKGVEDDELELDIDELSNDVLYQLLQFVRKHAPKAEDPARSGPAAAPAHTAASRKKNKPMSKVEQETRIQQVRSNLSTFDNPGSAAYAPGADMSAIQDDRDTSGDEDDSEESEEE